jgi:hypothetical protein
MKTCGGSGGVAPSYFTATPDAGEWLASRLRLFTPATYCIGDWLSPKAGLSRQ